MPFQTDSLIFDVLSEDPDSPVEGQMWFNTADKVLKVFRSSGGMFLVLAQDNMAATSPPLSTNDVVEGYAMGSRWFNTLRLEEFVCLSSAQGAAVWKRTTFTPTLVGQILMSVDGLTFSAELPLTAPDNNSAGWLVNDGGLLLSVG